MLIPDQGSHGIWGDYSVLILAISIYLYYQKEIKWQLALFSIFLSIVSTLLVVSRGSLFTLMIYFGLIFIYLFKNRIIVTKLGLIFMIIIMLFSLFILFSNIFTFYSFLSLETFPMIQKIIYTFQTFKANNTEMNIGLRLGGWWSGIIGLLHNPIELLIGCGYNLYCINTLISNGAEIAHITTYVALPESLFMLSLEYGGILGLILMTFFLIRSISFGFSCQHNRYLLLLSIYIIALLPTNLFSGASILADLLYGQLLLLIGINWNVKYKEK